jgi:hypothetical protein
MWQIEAIWANARALKYSAIMLKLIECILELIEGVCIMDILCIGYQFRKTHVNIDIPLSGLSSHHPSTI